jgi:hypothetical protein
MMGEVITDSLGRSIALRRVGVLEQLRLYKALGPELSRNDVYMSLAITASSAAMIDGVPVPFPASEISLEAILERLGDAGVRAIDELGVAQGSSHIIAAAGNS